MENNRQPESTRRRERRRQRQMVFSANHPDHAEQTASPSSSQPHNHEHTYQHHQYANHTYEDVFYSPPVIPQAIVAAYEPIPAWPQQSAHNTTLTRMIPPPRWDMHPSLAPDFSPSPNFSTAIDPRLYSNVWGPQVPENPPETWSWLSSSPPPSIYLDPAVISARLSARAPTDSYAAAEPEAAWPDLTQGSADVYVFVEPEAHDGEVALRVLRRAMERRRARLDARRAGEQARAAAPPS